MKLNFFNHSKLKVREYEKLIKEIFNNIASKNTFNIIFVDEDEIRKINKEYRNLDKVTDVISFALCDSPDELEFCDNELGDVFICLQRAFDQAKEYGHSVAREVGFLAVHGYLHLCGFDHMTKEDEKIMFAKQDEILKMANLDRGNN